MITSTACSTPVAVVTPLGVIAVIGALIGAVIGQAFDGTVLPLTLGFASVGMLAFVFVLIGEKGKLFGSITAANIADELSKKLGSEFDKRKVALGSPIKTVGKHSATVEVHPDVTATVVLEVVAS